jgi:hypothetical protein
MRQLASRTLEITVSDEVRRAAYHEAGHAVAHLRLRPSAYIGDITVVPDPEAGTLGTGKFEEIWAGNREAWIDEVIVLCAGYAAEMLTDALEGSARLGATDDFETAEAIIKRHGLDSLDRHIDAARELLLRPQNRRALDLFSRELQKHGTLLSDDVEVLLGVADDEITDHEYEAYRLFRHAPEMHQHE